MNMYSHVFYSNSRQSNRLQYPNKMQNMLSIDIYFYSIIRVNAGSSNTSTHRVYFSCMHTTFVRSGGGGGANEPFCTSIQ